MSIEVSSELIHKCKNFQPCCEGPLLFRNQLGAVELGAALCMCVYVLFHFQIELKNSS